MKVRSTVLAITAAFAMISGACTTASDAPGSGGTSSSGGSSSTGGNSSSGGAQGTGGKTSSGGSPGSGGSGSGSGGSTSSCPNVTACGGDAVGAWTAMSTCLKISGPLDISLGGLDPTTCVGPTIDASLDVTGTWTANANGTYDDKTTTKGTGQINLPAGCLHLSGTTTSCAKLSSPLSGIGFSSVQCSDAASGGGCTCSVTIEQQGGAGWPSAGASNNGNYKTANNVLTADQTVDYAYCVAGNKMTWTPQKWAAMLSGTIVFQKPGSTGSGGAVGSGGMVASGGTSGGSGGAGGKANGGSTASGGSSSGGSTGGGGAKGTGGSSTGRSEGPCDIYAAANTACAGAYSMVRALSKSYSGFLYQVRSGSNAMNTGSGGMTKDIGLTADGFADSATQDTFCNGTTCTVSILYDQSGNGNDLKVGTKGLSNGGTYAAMDDFEATATKKSLMVGGHKVYALYTNAREGYRTARGVKAKGVPMGNTAQGVYMLADGTHAGTACCYDFGSVSPDPTQYVTMNTLFFGTGFWGSGAGSGPWFMGDFEGGVWAGGTGDSKTQNNMSPSLKVPYALGILHTPVGKYALRMADTANASDLTTAYDGGIPSGKTWGNAGAIVLGLGGDNSNNSFGTFYEGALTNGSPSNATDLLIMKNIQAVGYGK